MCKWILFSFEFESMNNELIAQCLRALNHWASETEEEREPNHIDRHHSLPSMKHRRPSRSPSTISINDLCIAIAIDASPAHHRYSIRLTNFNCSFSQHCHSEWFTSLSARVRAARPSSTSHPPSLEPRSIQDHENINHHRRPAEMNEIVNIE